MPFEPSLFPSAAPEITPGRKIAASVDAVYAATGRDFVTTRTDRLVLDFEGIAGDYHRGLTRRAGGREPWHPRGAEIRNERQLTIVAADELAEIAKAMGISEILPERVGANVVLSGAPRLTMLPAGSLMFFENGATLKIDGLNRPCKLAGRSIADHAGMPDREAGALLFSKVAQRRRGLVAWVEKPGEIVTGEQVSIRIPEQWIYQP